MLRTLTEEELHTLERNLCISQDVEFPIRADTPVPPALEPALPAPLGPAGPRHAEAELACSVQDDDQELEQLSRMVHRAGDAMSSLLSPPNACQSPAHGPGAERGALGQASPGGPRLPPGSDEEEGRVFFMEDVDGAAEPPGGRRGRAGGPQERGRGGESRGAGAGAAAAAETAEDLSGSNGVQGDQTRAVGPGSCSCPDSQPQLDGWEASAEDAQTAELIAHRTGGMKLSATVIFNPKSPGFLDSALANPEVLGNGVSPGEPAAEGTEGGPHKLSATAANSLLNSCVCCRGCAGSREDAAESLRGKCGSGSVIRSSYVGSAKACAKGSAAGLLEVRPAPEALPTALGVPDPGPSEDAPGGQEPKAPTSDKCLAHTSGPQVDAADGLPGGGGGASEQKEAEARQPSEAGEESRRGGAAGEEAQHLPGSR